MADIWKYFYEYLLGPTADARADHTVSDWVKREFLDQQEQKKRGEKVRDEPFVTRCDAGTWSVYTANRSSISISNKEKMESKKEEDHHKRGIPDWAAQEYRDQKKKEELNGFHIVQ